MLAVACQRKPPKTEAEAPVLPPVDLTVGILVWDSLHQTEAELASSVFALASQYTPHAIRPTVIDLAPLMSRQRPKTAFSERVDLSDTLRLDILLVSSISLPSDTTHLKHVVTFIKSKSANAAYMVGTGGGVEILHRADLLNGHYFTGPKETLRQIGSEYPNFLTKNSYSLVHDRRLVTSTQPSDQVALYLIQLLYGRETTANVAQQLGLQWPQPTQKYFIAD